MSTETTVREQHIAFLGLGNMGGPMAANLVQAGYRVTGFDPMPPAQEAARATGVAVVGTMVEAVQEADVVLTMLPSGKHLLEAYMGQARPDDGAAPSAPEGTEGAPQGLLAAARPGTVFLDCSTIDVAESRRAAELAIAAGHRSVDAPVSGGVVGAEAGTLTFMVGGDDADVAAVADLLDVMGGRTVHCGGHGNGQAAKVCNNMLLGISMLGTVEAFVLGEQLGLDHQALFDVLSTSSGQCWSVTTNCPVPGPVPGSPANRDYRPGFASQLMLKDLTLAEQALADTGVQAQLGPAAAAIYRQWVEDGGAGKDFSGIIEQLRDRSAEV